MTEEAPTEGFISIDKAQSKSCLSCLWTLFYFVQINPRRNEKDEETGRRKEIEEKRYATLKRKEYEDAYVLSGERHKVEVKRYATPKRKEYEGKYVLSGKRHMVEKKRNSTPTRQEYKKK